MLIICVLFFWFNLISHMVSGESQVNVTFSEKMRRYTSSYPAMLLEMPSAVS